MIALLVSSLATNAVLVVFWLVYKAAMHDWRKLAKDHCAETTRLGKLGSEQRDKIEALNQRLISLKNLAMKPLE